MPSAESLILPGTTASSCQQCSDIGGQALLSACEIPMGSAFSNEMAYSLLRSRLFFVVLRKLHL